MTRFIKLTFLSLLIAVVTLWISVVLPFDIAKTFEMPALQEQERILNEKGYLTTEEFERLQSEARQQIDTLISKRKENRAIIWEEYREKIFLVTAIPWFIFFFFVKLRFIYDYLAVLIVPAIFFLLGVFVFGDVAAILFSVVASQVISKSFNKNWYWNPK